MFNLKFPLVEKIIEWERFVLPSARGDWEFPLRRELWKKPLQWLRTEVATIEGLRKSF